MTLWDEVGALVNSTVDALTARAVATESQLVAVRAELAAAQADVVGASKRIDELEGVVETLTADLVKARARIAELEKPADPAIIPFWGAPVWRDEFDGDLSKWNVRHNALTFDQARNMRENVTIEDGILHIRAKWLATPLSGSQYPQGRITHTSGYLDTIGKFSQQYGRWEIRAKMPADANTRGALSAFWLRCDSHNGEDDIIERWGQGGVMPKDYDPYTKDTGWTTWHSNTNGASNDDYLKTFLRHYQHGIPKDAADTWHVYTRERTPEHISTYVDGKLLRRITPDMMDPVNTPTTKNAKGLIMNPTGTYAWLWDPKYWGSPMNMRLNLHVGPSASFWGIPDVLNRSTTRDPLDMQVDYVRVYALPQ